eukprot:CAMPEP_0115412610 /NCGR_PEP_ID=MMETSP0271-20121206/21644_1 /TAXON_ID=71861 /ORGANISM="Scrippsiella trochoidea, Strain CCMP3099" /LENGTH=68 /DNA_ID=CAMNT_0002836865 /DNA_START=13 /DNA_END=215 /DNA_ORIENTATION=+
MSACVVVKHTFICVVEEEVPASQTGSRGRAQTTDVASLVGQLVHAPSVGEEDGEEMRKCSSAPAAIDA